MRPIIRRQKPKCRSFVLQLRRQRNSGADTLLLTNERWADHEIVPKRPSGHTTQQEPAQARPPVGARTVQSLAQPKPCPGSDNQPHTTAGSKQGHGDGPLDRTTAQSRYQQCRIQQSARHQGPQKTGDKYAAWCTDQGANAGPEGAACRLHPGRLARQKEHHQAPCQHSDVHERPGRTHGMCLLSDPGKALHRHGHCRTCTGISCQATEVIGEQSAQGDASAWVPVNNLLGGR